jgi:HPt (histidine-containing phosphotransfer) domain-containing protein
VSSEQRIPDSVPVIDQTRLLSEFGDSPEILAELRDLFLEHVPPLVQSITDAAAAGDAQVLTHHAHSLKGACSTYGAPRLVAVCRALEELGREGDVASIVQRIPEFEAEIERFVEHISTITVP